MDSVLLAVARKSKTSPTWSSAASRSIKLDGHHERRLRINQVSISNETAELGRSNGEQRANSRRERENPLCDSSLHPSRYDDSFSGLQCGRWRAAADRPMELSGRAHSSRSTDNFICV
jgi:hypothetical protein